MNMINLQIQIFFMALVGFVLGRKKVLDARTRGHLTDLVLMIALPCSIIGSFQMELSAQILSATLCCSSPSRSRDFTGYGITCFTAMRARIAASA